MDRYELWAMQSMVAVSAGVCIWMILLGVYVGKDWVRCLDFIAGFWNAIQCVRYQLKIFKATD